MSLIPVLENLHAWTTPMVVTELPEHEAIKAALSDFIYTQKQLQETAIASDVAETAKRALYESPLNFLQHSAVPVAQLADSIKNLLLMVAEEVNYGFWPENVNPQVEITESWFHITENGGYHDIHSHPNCSWCGIYYLDVGDCAFDERNGVNRFYDPRINAEHYLDAGNLYLNREGVWDIEPKAGQVVIFPSYLKHSALPYFGDKDRVVIAFNAQIHFAD